MPVEYSVIACNDDILLLSLLQKYVLAIFRTFGELKGCDVNQQICAGHVCNGQSNDVVVVC